MSCLCSKWGEIQGFKSPGEFKDFIKWIDSLVSEGVVNEVNVENYYGGSPWERWFQCKCGRRWRLVEPDPPFLGVFEPVDKT